MPILGLIKLYLIKYNLISAQMFLASIIINTQLDIGQQATNTITVWAAVSL